MSSVVIAGNTSGSVTLQAPDVAGTTTLTLPATSGAILTQNSSAPANSFVVDSSGNVGIGTSSPSSKLHVSGGSGSTIRNTASSGSSWFVGSNVDGYILHNESNTPMLFTTNGTERMRIDSSGNILFNSGYGSVATVYGCRAWVNFNGSGTVAIRASGNVTSITDNGTGDYTVNFTNAMPDANYTLSGGGKLSTFANSDVPCINFFRNTASPNATTSARIITPNLAGGLEDPTIVTVTFHR